MRKVIMITGGSRGIGAAVARLAAARDYDVAFTWVANQAAAEAVVADIERAGRRAVALQADVADQGALAAAFRALDAAFGRLDVLVNNAGIGPRIAAIEDITPERFARTLAVNLTGAFHAAQLAALRMARRHGGEGGVIINMSSMAARLGGAFEWLDYAASKGGMDTLTIGLAKELAKDGIRVNGVRPGLIETDIHAAAGDAGRVARLQSAVPLGRAGTPEDVAEAVLWLASPAASYLTGVTIDVAGGRGI